MDHLPQIVVNKVVNIKNLSNFTTSFWHHTLPDDIRDSSCHGPISPRFQASNVSEAEKALGAMMPNPERQKKTRDLLVGGSSNHPVENMHSSQILDDLTIGRNAKRIFWNHHLDFFWSFFRFCPTERTNDLACFANWSGYFDLKLLIGLTSRSWVTEIDDILPETKSFMKKDSWRHHYAPQIDG